jgi:hypothetical protein
MRGMLQEKPNKQSNVRRRSKALTNRAPASGLYRATANECGPTQGTARPSARVGLCISTLTGYPAASAAQKLAHILGSAPMTNTFGWRVCVCKVMQRLRYPVPSDSGPDSDPDSGPDSGPKGPKFLLSRYQMHASPASHSVQLDGRQFLQRTKMRRRVRERSRDDSQPLSLAACIARLPRDLPFPKECTG